MGLCFDLRGSAISRGTKMKILILVVLVASAVLFGACVSPSTVAEEEQEIEEGWIRLRVEGVGSIDYPSDFLELQSEEYRDMAEGYYEITVKSDFTLQQVGLNELLPSAFDEYRRVVFQTIDMNPGEEVFRANEKYTMSQRELAELEAQLIDELVQGFEALKTMGQENKLIESISLEIEEVNGMFPLVHTYKRQLNDNPVVLVKAYSFWDYDRIHYLLLSYRVVDEEECRGIYDRIINSFRLLED